MKSLMYYIKNLFSYSGSILYLNIVGMAFISFIEGLSILMLIPLLSLVGIIDANFEFEGLKVFLDYFQNFSEVFTLSLVLFLYILLIGLQGLIDRNLSIRNVRINHGFIGKIRVDTYQSLMNANWEFYTKKRKSDLINIMTIELARVSGGIYQFIKLLTAIIFSLIQICFALWLSVEMTLFVLFSGAILSLFSYRFIKQSKSLGKRTSKLSQEYLAGITDQLNGIKDIKSNALETSRISWLHEVVQGMYKEQIGYIKLKISSQLLYKMSSTILIAIFIFFSVRMFNSEPGQFLLILIIFSRLWPRITGIQSNIEQLAATVPAFKALNDLRMESSRAKETNFNSSKEKAEPLIIKKSIECNNISFSYNSTEEIYALNNIKINFPANQVSAIVGPSGAGKSTLIDMLMGLNTPNQGQVLIDNESISNINMYSLRKAISYVPQDPFLFNASIRENFRLINPDITSEQIWESLEFAAADRFVSSLPNGLDTEIGERGFKLSGGERQRLVLARAIAKKPTILILDEATSALDIETEAIIQQSLDQLKGKMTIIIIAHRLSTIYNADQVIVMDKGSIIESGEYNKLSSNTSGVFNGLIQKQAALISS
jgi:ABC-type multidrug transport system fused ATPase/permease subunit